MVQYIDMGIYGAIIGFGIAVAIYILMAMWLLKMYKSSKPLWWGRRLAVFLIVFYLLGQFVMLSDIIIPWLHYGKVRSGSLKKMAQAFDVYADDHNGVVPDAENWCDTLIIECGLDPGYFITMRPERYGESSYVLNKNAAGKKFADLPYDMVLVFETKCDVNDTQRNFPLKLRAFYGSIDPEDRDEFMEYAEVCQSCWNQAGGPELFVSDKHGANRCRVLFADGKVKFVKQKNIPQLRWTAEGEENFLSKLLRAGNGLLIRSIAAVVLAVVVFTAARVIFIRYPLNGHVVFSLVLGFISAAVGGLYGLYLEVVCVTKGDLTDIGFVAIFTAALTGLLCGICYTAVMVNTARSLKQISNFTGYAAASGMIAAMICSAVISLVLMTMHNEKLLLGAGFVMGFPLSLAVGFFVGGFCGILIEKFCLKTKGLINSSL